MKNLDSMKESNSINSLSATDNFLTRNNNSEKIDKTLDCCKENIARIQEGEGMNPNINCTYEVSPTNPNILPTEEQFNRIQSQLDAYVSPNRSNERLTIKKPVARQKHIKKKKILIKKNGKVIGYRIVSSSSRLRHRQSRAVS